MYDVATKRCRWARFACGKGFNRVKCRLGRLTNMTGSVTGLVSMPVEYKRCSVYIFGLW